MRPFSYFLFRYEEPSPLIDLYESINKSLKFEDYFDNKFILDSKGNLNWKFKIKEFSRIKIYESKYVFIDDENRIFISLKSKKYDVLENEERDSILYCGNTISDMNVLNLCYNSKDLKKEV